MENPRKPKVEDYKKFGAHLYEKDGQPIDPEVKRAETIVLKNAQKAGYKESKELNLEEELSLKRAHSPSWNRDQQNLNKEELGQKIKALEEVVKTIHNFIRNENKNKFNISDDLDELDFRANKLSENMRLAVNILKRYGLSGDIPLYDLIPEVEKVLEVCRKLYRRFDKIE